MTEKSREDEWFQKFEQELIRDAKRKRELAAKAAVEKEASQPAALKCPRCGSDMAVLDIHGVAVDECTGCKGLFFDRGEMEDLFLRKSEDRRSIFRRLAGLVS